jgi:hypothetical protein
MDEEVTEKKEKTLKGPTAAEKMLGMNWEAIHDKVELYGIAGLCAGFMARGMSGDRLAKAVSDALTAARDVKTRLDNAS